MSRFWKLDGPLRPITQVPHVPSHVQTQPLAEIKKRASGKMFGWIIRPWAIYIATLLASAPLLSLSLTVGWRIATAGDVEETSATVSARGHRSITAHSATIPLEPPSPSIVRASHLAPTIMPPATSDEPIPSAIPIEEVPEEAKTDDRQGH